MYEVIKKVNKRLYFLSQMKRAQVKPKDLTTFYITCIRSVMEYVCAFHNSLPQYLSNDLEYCQKRALRIIYPYASYDQALKETGITSLNERRDEITSTLFKDACNPRHKLNKILLKKYACLCNFRRTRTFANPTTSTKRTQLNLVNFNAYNSYTL